MPTLLSLMDISASGPMLGQDLSQVEDNWQGRALMQYEKNFALMQGNKVTILQPELEPKSFVYDFSAEKLTAKDLDSDQANTALAWALWGSMAYNKQWFRLPKKASNLETTEELDP